jgi:hypothetical protein
MSDGEYLPNCSWSEEELELWTNVQKAWRDEGCPPPSKIRADAALILRMDLRERTISGWLEGKSLPRADEGFLALVQVLGAEQRHDWPAMLRAARTARKVRLAQAPPTSGASVPTATVPPAADPPSVVIHSATRRRRVKHGMSAAAAVTLIVGGFAVGYLSGQASDRKCATVTASPDSAVFLDPEQAPVKRKRFGERVELYTALDDRESGGKSFHAVLIREGATTYGWIAADDLRAADCAEA